MSIKRLGRQRGNDYPAGLNFSGYGSYRVTKSLRFRASNSAYLNRTFTTPTSAQKFTWSGWVKRGTLGTNGYGVLFANNPMTFALNSATYSQGSYPDDTLLLWDFGTNSYFAYCNPNPVWRDPAAWYHIVLSVDTTQATASNRVKIYVNGVNYATTVTIGQNTNLITAASHQIGKSFYAPVPAYFDGEMTEINFIDGQQLTPSSFGATDPTTGIWQPVAYTGTYGLQGFYLPFTDTTSVFTLGNDAGNGNNWTLNNFSLTAGATYDSMTDVPTLTSVTAANYAVMNPLDTGGSTLSNGNLTQTTPSTGYGATRATIAVSSGKWYWEVTPTSLTGGAQLGICGISESFSTSTQLYNLATSYSYWSNAYKGNNGSSESYGASYAANDVIGVALDLDNGTLTFYKNNSSQGTAYTGLSGTFAPAVCDNSNSSASVFNWNFGQQAFAYTPPTGYSALNTYNLPDPTIKVGSQHFDATIYTGTGSALAITNSGQFEPSLVWIKSRSTSSGHVVQDSIRGTLSTLYTQSTNAEQSDSGQVTSFNSNGFTLGTTGDVNYSAARTYVAWQWKGASSNTTNTDGSITSLIRANPTAGFSVVTYTGNGTTGTVGHGLGVAPSFIIVKDRTQAVSWIVYQSTLGAGKFLELNTTASVYTDTRPWNNTSPTSSVFSVGNYNNTNNSGDSYVAYCWAQVAGFSAFGSYTGNGSTDGPFVYCGFKPKYIMMKRTDSTGYWVIFDTSRNPYNSSGEAGLWPNAADAEANYTTVDMLSNGTKIRETSTTVNASGGTYIYAAFAEYPFKNGNAAIYNIN